MAVCQKGTARIEGFTTVCTHPYHVIYNAGSLPYADHPADGTVSYTDDGLVFDLQMPEPELETVLARLEKEPSTPFLSTDLVSINLIVPGNRLVQVMFRPDGAQQTVGLEGKSAVDVRTGDKLWTATVRIPWAALSMSLDDFRSQPLPFDLVRFHRATGTVTSWSPLPDQLPFNEPYDFPVYCFGLLAANDISWAEYAGQNPDLGRLVYDGPKQLIAGTSHTLRFVYTAGSNGLPHGGTVVFNLGNEVIECNRGTPLTQAIRHLPEKDWSALQWTDRTAPGFVEVVCSRKEANLTLNRELYFSVTIRNEGAALKPGDTVTLTVGGSKDGPGIRTQLLTQKNYPFKFYYDLTGNGCRLPAEFPTIDIIARPAVSLLLHAPATPDAGEEFELKVVAIDSFGNIADGYTGEVSLFAPDGVSGLPERIRFSSEDHGIKTLILSATAREAFVLRAIDAEDSSISGMSNLIVTDGTFGPGKIFFGDIHTHSQLSDGRLHPFDKYLQTREHRGLDYWALTDHCFDLTPQRFELLNETLEKFNQPGRFATLPGYEWTSNMMQERPWVRPHPGHRNILFRRMPKRIYNAVCDESNTPEKLKAVLEREEPGNYTVASHFHCGDPTVLPRFDETLEVSGWCNSFPREFTGMPNDIQGKTSVNDGFALSPGLGMVAGTDHGTEAYYTGLPAEMTAVKTAALDRESVFDALKGGTVYATSGQKVLLKFTVNGTEPQVGSGAITCIGPRKIEFTIGSAMPVINAVLVRNGKDIKGFPGYLFGVKRYEFTDSESLESGYYYVRVHTAQGYKTWSSPVWFVSGN